MNVTFGAKLTTPVQNFYLDIDTEANKKHIQTMFKEIDGFLNMPEVEKFTKGDTVELVRSYSKDRFKYKIFYKSAEPLHECITKGIKMDLGNNNAFGSFSTIFQISNAVYSKRGKMPSIKANMIEHISHAFDMTPEQLSQAVSKMLKNIL